MSVKRQKVLIEGGNIDIENNWDRQLGQVDLARVKGSALSHSNPVIARLTDGSAFIDPRDVIDRADRLLGIVYGSEGQQIQQRATTYDLLVQLRHAGSEIDPRNIRALTSSDQITALQPDPAQLKATVTQAEKDRLLKYGIDQKGSDIDELAFTYDASGKLTQIDYKSGGTTIFYLTFTYDAAGKLTNITRTEP